jgi:hypothetical protein
MPITAENLFGREQPRLRRIKYGDIFDIFSRQIDDLTRHNRIAALAIPVLTHDFDQIVLVLTRQ